ncbi:MAG TPA: peptidoglycan recognition family protein [Bryobacteraceae bacterium]|nr:peptidoglycan recognition family protein [Bryobacteraceae bacterium]
MQKRGRRFPSSRWSLNWRAWSFAPVAILLLLGFLPRYAGTAETVARERRLTLPASGGSSPAGAAAQKVWLVDRSVSFETYSNGLRIDLNFAVSNQHRGSYPVFPLNGGSGPVRYGTVPAGIVYHTTESHLAPFEEDQNRRLKQIGRNLIEVVRQERGYHYVIDRFGRVFRVVEESDAANHAGKSVWADASGIYVNLNSSFLGIAFESQTGAAEQVTPAQISAGRMLTQMLRARYSIPAGNCVTHAQVSVNPLNMRIGEHTDWGSQFPFAAMGLPDNYAVPPPSLYAFGFDYDDAFLHAISSAQNGAPWRGLALADDQVARQAAAEGLSAARYRRILQHRYKDIAALLEQRQEQSGGSS